MRSVMSCFLSVPSLCRQWGRVGILACGVSLACVGLARADDSGNLTLQLLDRVNALEDQTRQMRGQIDQLTNQVQQQNATLSKQVEDMNFAMQHGHGGAAAGTAMAAPAAAATGAAPAAVKRTPDEVLKAGNEALLKQDYATAQADAQQVLSGPKSPRQVDAQYLLAQSLAGQKQYRQSALAYYDAYNRAPHGQRAPSALLGVAATLVALNDKASACQALDKLSSEFPEPAARIKSAEQVYRKRAKCN
ncbi:MULTISPECIES: tol-pal system YbgF family protein [Komagataeibacter]|uniref:Tol-pal system protein n=2 Tax=Komagataeibacter TaxID=1434011 RepID=A0A318QU35_9PROT|nr:MULTISPECIES: hypothetical protein [Komagataeibacter]MBL7234514.1 hypothetical protein [Komagataeibacter oboediens]MBT0676368.1 hypothetical protein [Komagataeibacter oboediens]MBT0679530.1 hypothetical protein [Komagataeibacter oboediens]PYD82575.1 hypothetical protein CFR80_05880 [Komagataeibacter oboediens]WEQ52678.1 hypothetical protein LV478_03775 [Komagataeibacter oboediens]